MKKLRLFIIMFICANSLWGEEIFAETKERFRYFSVGTGPILLIPHLSLGYRTRNFRYGTDVSFGYSTIGYVHQLQALFIKHRYLDPFKKDSSYLGLGASASGLFLNKGDTTCLFAPDLVFGKLIGDVEKRRHFIEMHLQIPNIYLDKGCKITWLPLMFIKYGTSF